MGREGLKQFFSELRTAFPDLQVSVDDIVAEGDTVAIRFNFTGTHQGEFMGIAPTGTPAVGAGMDFFRIEGGQIVELWGIEDVFGLLQQLGSQPGAESI